MTSRHGRGMALAFSLALAACRPVLVPGQQFTMENFTVPAPRERVFDAALAVSQRLNLQVAVIEKASGFIRFENAVLTPQQLDDFCDECFVTGDRRHDASRRFLDLLAHDLNPFLLVTGDFSDNV